MRFISDGPNIPDELLEARDRGNVVFFCGAGVSMPQMPSFAELTKHVIDELQVSATSSIQIAFNPWRNDEGDPSARTPLDQIFNSLYQTYDRDIVGTVVANRLGVKKGYSTKSHSIIARLSASADGVPQIVTTNFDLLFEQPSVIKSPRLHVPPTFPDLRHNQPISGITYLHGRINEDGNTISHSYVLSSADFGKAYLAEAWATKFVRELLTRYTVVLLGYQADDPPVKYLLQGLNSLSDRDKSNLYAFDYGDELKMEAKWGDRGVTPISYIADKKHTRLWETLEQWAKRADNPADWRSNVIDMAQQGPQTLEPHQRGQVVHLVRSSIGAKLFADASPSLPSDWICVFDHIRRTADETKSWGEDQETFNPIELFGIDSDASNTKMNVGDRSVPDDNLISWRHGDERPTDQFRLSGYSVPGYEKLPPRLYHLARWIMSVSLEPTIAWWVSQQPNLHPRLQSMISSRIESADDLPPSGRSTWNLLFECFARNDSGPTDMKWYETHSRIKREGWTPSVLRSFKNATSPYVKISRSYGITKSKPPTKRWEELDPRDIADFGVAFPGKRAEKTDIPDTNIPAVYTILQRNLEAATDLLKEVDKKWWKTKTLYPEETAGRRYLSDAESYIQWFVQVFDKMSVLHAEHTRSDVELWPDNEPFIFDKLKLYAWNKSALYTANEAAKNILGLEQKAFWKQDHRREFLILVRDRWIDFTDEERLNIEERFLAGPDKSQHESDEDFSEHKAYRSVTDLGWLRHNGKTLSEATLDKIYTLKLELPEWNEKWSQDAARSLDGYGGAVQVNTDPTILVDLPLHKIVQTALNNSGHQVGLLTENRPFSGLVASYPVKALSSLKVAAIGDEYPQELWQTLIQEWPSVSDRLNVLFVERMRCLPDDLVYELRHTVFAWVRDKLPKLAEVDEEYALIVFDDLLGKVLSAGARATKSGIGDSLIDGTPVQRSRKTIDHAINSPIGYATEALISILNARKLKESNGMPDDIASRFERLFASPGDGTDYAVCLVAAQINWLHYIAPEWVSSRMIPWFSTQHPVCEPAWNGLFHTGRIPSPKLFKQLKPSFLNLYGVLQDWNWDDSDERQANEFLLFSCRRHLDDDSYVGYGDALNMIRKFTDKGRCNTVYCLLRIAEENETEWDRFVFPFISNAWPKENQFRVESLTEAFLALLEESHDHFPKALSSVLPFLRPMHQGSHSIYKFHRSMKEEGVPLAIQHPTQTLQLLDAITPRNPIQVPYDLGTTLNLIADADPATKRTKEWMRLEEIVADG